MQENALTFAGGAEASGPNRRTVLAGAAGAVGAGVAATALSGSVSALAAPPVPDAQEALPVALTVNGARRSAQVDPRASLLDTLRDQWGLTGPKKGCDQGACGACTVLLDGTRVLSCISLAVLHDGREITTVEGLVVKGEMHPVQRAFAERDGFQCGFCTSGQVTSAVGLLRENPRPSRAEISELMSGNLCRCAAYSNIVDAVIDAARGER
ncbi:aldehyde dehydrogenase iron-sulfur subunit [Allokutzneria multivorans]|uniref:Aldehyde dehydrogenase iron-sulfur subunit n=1 Tax=Allokutzneria multivorans TaxID=1142134 RepID=A0ABP7U4Y1_9PSEU